MTRERSRTIVLSWLALTSLLLPAAVFAQSATEGPGLLDSRLTYANDVERAAAAANQATFDALDTQCNPNGQLDTIAAPSEELRPGGCTSLQFFVYLTTRELVHSANALLGEGPTVASLNVTEQGLGTALRWTAAEELAVQGSMATQFSSNQLSNLATRLTALRAGASGFTVAGLNDLPESWRHAAIAGLSLSENGNSGTTLGRWGGFVNASLGNGDKSPTGNENAFDYDTQELTLGLDYRIGNATVVGGMLGISRQDVEFVPDSNRISVVDGSIEGDGTSVIVFIMTSTDRWYASASLGSQQIDYALERDIRYPSFNPNVADSNSRATSEPEASVTTATAALGYTWAPGAWQIEPYIGFEYLDVTIDAFDEARSFNALSGQIDSDAFNLVIAEQTFQSLDSNIGLRLQYTLTPSWGVAAPYLNLAYHRELQNDPRVIEARYAGAGNEAFAFAVQTDPFDSDYFTWAVGVSAVVRGARERRYGGSAGRGISVFTQFEAVERLDFYSEQIISAGLRYEF
ncbi:MAG: autotransporter outer membrane beta-barrel domain-containing protein [Pseudomonadota bacterium]